MDCIAASLCCGVRAEDECHAGLGVSRSASLATSSSTSRKHSTPPAHTTCLPGTQASPGKPSPHHDTAGPRFNIKMSSYQYRKSHCGDKTVVRSSYLHDGISYTSKMTSLYWIGVQPTTTMACGFFLFGIRWYGLYRITSLALGHTATWTFFFSVSTILNSTGCLSYLVK